MTVFSTIPKLLASRTSETYTQRIPKIIWQTMKTNVVPQVMKDYSNSWQEQNPEYEYRFFDDEDISQFIAAEFPEYVRAFKKIKHGAVKADLWRYLIIYKYGGVYADMDCRCIVPLRKWIQPDAEWVTQLGINRDVCQWLIISVPENPVFKRAAEKSLRNLLKRTDYSQYRGFQARPNQSIALRENTEPIRSYHPIMKLAGPPVLQEAAEECFVANSESPFFRSIQIVCVSGNVSCQMNGNVQHEYLNEEYVRGLRELSTPHYEDSLRQSTGWSRLIDTIRRKAKRLYGAITR